MVLYAVEYLDQKRTIKEAIYYSGSPPVPQRQSVPSLFDWQCAPLIFKDHYTYWNGTDLRVPDYVMKAASHGYNPLSAYHSLGHQMTGFSGSQPGVGHQQVRSPGLEYLNSKDLTTKDVNLRGRTWIVLNRGVS